MSGQNVEEIVRHTKTDTQISTELRVPRKFKVVLLNDDYTPMDFVVEVLKHFFHLSEEIAVQVMLQVHLQGKGVYMWCLYTRYC